MKYNEYYREWKASGDIVGHTGNGNGWWYKRKMFFLLIKLGLRLR